jgi:hypothetical protein
VPARLREAIEVGILAAITALGFARAGDLREMVDFARATRDAVRSDDDLLRSPGVLGPEAPLFETLRRQYPPGTAVAVHGHAGSVARAQRFWLALLPLYPIRGDAALRLCPHPCDEPGDRVLARGVELVLLDRSGRP